MADQVARLRQYEYRANSNLVLTTDQHRPRQDEPSGEPESLKEHLSGTKMGDRVIFSRPDVVDGGKKRKTDKNAAAIKRAKKESENVLGIADDIDSYRPRSKETRSAYEDLLSILSQQLGDQPHDILRGAADEVLACLKNDGQTDPERKREVGKLVPRPHPRPRPRPSPSPLTLAPHHDYSSPLHTLTLTLTLTLALALALTQVEKLVNHLSQEGFAQLVQVGKRITDYAVDEGAGNEKLDVRWRFSIPGPLRSLFSRPPLAFALCSPGGLGIETRPRSGGAREGPSSSHNAT